jgi:pimeloyl-ACP methyl ester carboxylesterase
MYYYTVITRFISALLDQKTLLLWGDKDQVFPVHLGYRLQRYSLCIFCTPAAFLNSTCVQWSDLSLFLNCRHLGDGCKLEIIKDAGHTLQMEAAGKVNTFIDSFLTDDAPQKGIDRKSR